MKSCNFLQRIKHLPNLLAGGRIALISNVSEGQSNSGTQWVSAQSCNYHAISMQRLMAHAAGKSRILAYKVQTSPDRVVRRLGNLGSILGLARKGIR
jgi:hypothetical protein